VLLKLSGFRLDEQRLPDRAAKARVLRAVDRGRDALSLKSTLRLVRLSPAPYHAWKRADKRCELLIGKTNALCLRRPTRHNDWYREIRRSSSSRWAKRQAGDAEQHEIYALPDEALRFLLPSRHCEVDRMLDITWQLFGHMTSGWARVQAVCDLVHQHIHFDYLQARSTRTAYEAYHERVGVCRDFTHLAIALCRCLNIPGR
jgi:hypothetical protein